MDIYRENLGNFEICEKNNDKKNSICNRYHVFQTIKNIFV